MLRSIVCLVVLFIAGVPAVAQTPTPIPDPCAELKTRADRAETRLRDWPALARYRDDNAKVGLPAKGEQRIVFMGDSITDSWDAPNMGGFFPASRTSTEASVDRQLRKCLF